MEAPILCNQCGLRHNPNPAVCISNLQEQVRQLQDSNETLDHNYKGLARKMERAQEQFQTLPKDVYVAIVKACREANAGCFCGCHITVIND